MEEARDATFDDEDERFLAVVGVRASHALRIPIVGLDIMVFAIERRRACVHRANERPGLAFHDPAPVVARFVGLLFPETATGWLGALAQPPISAHVGPPSGDGP